MANSREEVKKEIDQMMKSYKERVGLQGDKSSSSSDESDDGDMEFDPTKKSRIRRNGILLQTTINQ